MLICLLACVQANKNLVSVAFETKITVNLMLCSSKRNIAKLTLWIFVKFQFALANGFQNFSQLIFICFSIISIIQQNLHSVS